MAFCRACINRNGGIEFIRYKVLADVAVFAEKLALPTPQVTGVDMTFQLQGTIAAAYKQMSSSQSRATKGAHCVSYSRERKMENIRRAQGIIFGTNLLVHAARAQSNVTVNSRFCILRQIAVTRVAIFTSAKHHGLSGPLYSSSTLDFSASCTANVSTPGANSACCSSGKQACT